MKVRRALWTACGLIGISLVICGPALAASVGQGNACDRNGEQSWIAGVFLLCDSNIWTAQAPQAVSAGLSTVTCDSTRLGLMRVFKPPLATGNALQFCDGATWKTISLL